MTTEIRGTDQKPVILLTQQEAEELLTLLLSLDTALTRRVKAVQLLWNQVESLRREKRP